MDRGDAQLLAAWANGDLRAGDALVRRHFASIFRFLRRRVDTAAEDLAQHTFEAALQHHERFVPGGSFKAFVFGIAKNQVRMHHRSAGRQVAVAHAPAATPPAPDTSPSQRIASKEERKILARAMEALPAPMQIAVELYYWEGLTSAEVGEVLEISTSAVTSRLSRAREHLRQTVATMDIGDALRRSTLHLVSHGLQRA